ncbi:MAG: SAM-dependent methyltransferase [Acidimicrobiaceae bacterium]|nr:SAM-dependent methyltransferase [Acidimicrobiaceae bacterium]
MICRHCREPVDLVFVDLGSSPPSNAYLCHDALGAPEARFPLRVLVCESCWLVQTEDFVRADVLFDADYAYFSGQSETWVSHCRRFAEEMVERFALTESSQVIEVASNDGTLLRWFHDRGMACTGIEPTERSAAIARGLGLTVIEEFLTAGLADQLVGLGPEADLLVANNVLAHVPDINDFATACSTLLADGGVATFEFPHVLQLVALAQFDTIYHEHFSYLSLAAVETVLSSAGLTVFDVERLTTHGGSLRVFAQHVDSGSSLPRPRVDAVRALEAEAGVASAEYYSGFQDRADHIRNEFVTFLLTARDEGKSVAAYGAAAKGNTLLNYAGVDSDLISFVADRNPIKQGKYMPGSKIPIVDEANIVHRRPDHVVVLPWNLREEIASQLDYIRDWSGTFVTAVPELEVW